REACGRARRRRRGARKTAGVTSRARFAGHLLRCDDGVSARLAPLYGSEVIVPEKRVENSEGRPRLRSIADYGVSGIAPVPEVLDRDRVLLVNAHRKRYGGASDVVVTAASEVVRGDVAHEVFAQAQVQRGA